MEKKEWTRDEFFDLIMIDAFKQKGVIMSIQLLPSEFKYKYENMAIDINKEIVDEQWGRLGGKYGDDKDCVILEYKGEEIVKANPETPYTSFKEKSDDTSSKKQEISEVHAGRDVTINQFLDSDNKPQTQKRKNTEEKGTNKPHKHQYVVWIIMAVVGLAAILIPIGLSKGWF